MQIQEGAQCSNSLRFLQSWQNFGVLKVVYRNITASLTNQDNLKLDVVFTHNNGDDYLKTQHSLTKLPLLCMYSNQLLSFKILFG
jgi:hypothetical protein